MKKYNSDFSLVSDLELLDKFVYYLTILCPMLPFPRLQHHCKGAIASIFELYYYLKFHNLEDYANNKK